MLYLSKRHKIYLLQFKTDSIETIIELMDFINDSAQIQAVLSEQVNASVDEINKMSVELVEFAKHSTSKSRNHHFAFMQSDDFFVLVSIPHQ